MKNLIKSLTILSILFMLLFVQNTFAQRGRAGEINWFSASVKGGYGSTMLVNYNIFNDRYVKPSIFNSSYCYGGKLAFNFTNTVSINVEVIQNSLSQSYSVDSGVTKFDKNIKISTFDIPVLMRFTSENKGFAEIGVAFSSLKSATDKYTNLSSDLGSGAVSYSSTALMNGSATKLVIGIGSAIAKGETFDLNLGMRMTYSFSELAKDPLYPFNDLYYAPLNGPAKTNPFTIMAMLEFHYYLGYFATSSCGKRKGFIFF